MTSHVSLRVPTNLVEAFDRIAAALERPRSWVMLRALRQYLDKGEGREIEEAPEPVAETPVVDLMEALRASVAASKKGSKPAPARKPAAAKKRAAAGRK